MLAPLRTHPYSEKCQAAVARQRESKKMTNTYKVRAGWDDYEFTTDKEAPYVVIVWQGAKPPAFYPYATESAAARGVTYRLKQCDRRGIAARAQWYDTYQEA